MSAAHAERRAERHARWRAAHARWHATRRRWRHSLKWRLVTVFLVLALATTGVFLLGMQRVVSTGWQGYAKPIVADCVDRLGAEIGSPPDAARAQAIVARLPVSVRIEGPTVRYDSHPEYSARRLQHPFDQAQPVILLPTHQPQLRHHRFAPSSAMGTLLLWVQGIYEETARFVQCSTRPLWAEAPPACRRDAATAHCAGCAASSPGPTIWGTIAAARAGRGFPAARTGAAGPMTHRKPAMRDAVIRKTPADWRVPPNLDAGARAAFSWAAVQAELGPPDDFNIARLALDRHVAQGRGARVALRCLAADGTRTDLSYAELARLTNRFANGLRTLGVAPGERVFVMAGRVAPLYVAVLGSLKAGCVVTPLFSAFGPEPIATRIGIAQAGVLVTTEALYRRKVEQMRAQLGSLKQVILIGDGNAASALPGTVDYQAWMVAAPEHDPPLRTRADDLALLHFTSGTTGTPKGAMHVHGAALMHHASGRFALDLHAGDVFWCTADPGWVTGTSYGIVAPLLHGVTSIVDEAEFDAERWYRILHEQQVSVWYTAPTAIRMLMKAGPELARRYTYPKLRFVASVGEPLNPEAVWWGREVLGLPIHDNWWQTETGGIMIANTPAMDIKPGSMGRPLPGVEAAIVQMSDGAVRVVTEPDVQGELALRAGWPSMFRGYLDQDERYRKCFADGWYRSGDLARRDADGDYWFVGRADDVIKSAGHLIGPFEVESALLEHPAVAEAGVIGIPDPTVGEVVKAFVALKPGIEPSEALQRELLGHARKKLGAAVAPKAIDFRAGLPRTRSGKIMRRLLKARELGLPEGDLSTLESDERK